MLLTGPRGRRLCYSLLAAADSTGWAAGWDGAHEVDLTGRTDELAACVARMDLASIADSAAEPTLMAALADTVSAAMYWQEPDSEDRGLDDQAVRDTLRPVARAVGNAPAARWWFTPAAIGRQRYVEWLEPDIGPPAVTGAAGQLASWRAALLAEEQEAASWPDDPTAPWSGHWWSTPVQSNLPSTTRWVPGLAALRLALVEDALGWSEARCWPVEPGASARIYEISEAAEWTELVARYPINVTKSRRHVWWRATGRDGRWLIPDYAAVAEDYDAVHVTVAGYLTTAGRALPVGDAATVLAGWDPDQTYWLTDVLTITGPATTWVNPDGEPFGWTPGSAA